MTQEVEAIVKASVMTPEAGAQIQTPEQPVQPLPQESVGGGESQTVDQGSVVRAVTLTGL